MNRIQYGILKVSNNSGLCTWRIGLALLALSPTVWFLFRLPVAGCSTWMNCALALLLVGQGAAVLTGFVFCRLNYKFCAAVSIFELLYSVPLAGAGHTIQPDILRGCMMVKTLILCMIIAAIWHSRRSASADKTPWYLSRRSAIGIILSLAVYKSWPALFCADARGNDLYYQVMGEFSDVKSVFYWMQKLVAEDALNRAFAWKFLLAHLILVVAYDFLRVSEWICWLIAATCALANLFSESNDWHPLILTLKYLLLCFCLMLVWRLFVWALRKIPN